MASPNLHRLRNRARRSVLLVVLLVLTGILSLAATFRESWAQVQTGFVVAIFDGWRYMGNIATAQTPFQSEQSHLSRVRPAAPSSSHMLVITSLDEWAERSSRAPSEEFGSFYLSLASPLIHTSESAGLSVPAALPALQATAETTTTVTVTVEAEATQVIPLATPAPPVAFEPLPSPTARPDGSIVYEVVAGDTLSGIASQFGVPLTDLYAFNDLDADRLITIGQEIVIGYTNAATRVAAAPYVPPGTTLRDDGAYIYAVVAGDSLIAIAASYDLTLPEILQLNQGLSAGSLLSIGQELIVGHRPQPQSSGGSTDMPPGLASPTTLPPTPTMPLPTTTSTTQAAEIASAGLEVTAAPTLRPLPTASSNIQPASSATGAGMDPLTAAVVVVLVVGGLLAFIIGRRR